MNVEMNEFGMEESPDIIETTGLGPCIGVAIAYDKYGFILHSPDVIMEQESVTDPFFALLDNKIPSSYRQLIIPVIAGGCVDTYGGSAAEDREIQERILAARKGILRRLTEFGFYKTNYRWANPGESQSLCVDWEEHKIIRITDYSQELELPQLIEPIEYEFKRKRLANRHKQ